MRLNVTLIKSGYCVTTMRLIDDEMKLRDKVSQWRSSIESNMIHTRCKNITSSSFEGRDRATWFIGPFCGRNY